MYALAGPLNTPVCDIVSPFCPRSQLGDEGPLNRDKQHKTTAGLHSRASSGVKVSLFGDLDKVKDTFSLSHFAPFNVLVTIVKLMFSFVVERKLGSKVSRS